MEEMLIKYNEKYDRWCRSDGKIYKQTKDGKFIECKQSNRNGYLRVYCGKLISSHRLIWETLKGPIPNGYEIDHINTVRDDNRLENLRCITHAENNRNPLSRKNHSISMKGKPEKSTTEFGIKYKEHFGVEIIDNHSLYCKEWQWYKRNGKCRWEV